MLNQKDYCEYKKRVTENKYYYDYDLISSAWEIGKGLRTTNPIIDEIIFKGYNNKYNSIQEFLCDIERALECMV